MDTNEQDTEDIKGKEPSKKTPSKKTPSKKSRFFEVYISKVLKIIPIRAGGGGITSNGKQQLNSALCIIAKKIFFLVSNLTILYKKKTISVKEISNSFKLLYPSYKDIIDRANIAIETYLLYLYNSTQNPEEIKGKSRQDQAGIIFPPATTEKFLRNFGYSKIMITKSSPIFLASVLEQITEKILIIASGIAKENNHIRITIRDLELSIQSDKDLKSLFSNCNTTFVGGGVVPQIHESLLKKTKKKKKALEDPVVIPENKKAHRFRPGTVSLREIKKFQKTSNCLTFAKAPFERFIRPLVGLDSVMKISKEVFIVIQYYLEQFITDFLRDANASAIHSGRVKLIPSDIVFISTLRKYDPLDIGPFIKVEAVMEPEEVVKEIPVDQTLLS